MLYITNLHLRGS